MSMLRRVIGPSVLLIAAAVTLNGRCQESTAEDAAPAATDPYAVPEGDAAALLSSIEDLASPDESFEDREQAEEFLDRASTAISTAADKVLAGEATEKQAVDAMQWRVEALRIRGMLGDEDAAQHRDAFLDQMLKDPRPAVAGMVAPMRLVPKLPLERWFRLSDAQRAEAVGDYVADVQAAGPTVTQAQLLDQFCDMLADTADSGLALRAIDALLPTLAKSADPDIQEIASSLEGMARRINLPGSKIELEGTLMDGTKLDWESYRGKVVLVDFWASWCGPCRREVPNVLANYKAYHDKGFEVLGVCLDDDRSEAEKYVQEAGVVWPSLFDDKPEARGWNHPMAEKYAVNGVPRAILVDQAGRVVDNVNADGMQLGMLARGPFLGAQLRQLLGEPLPVEGPAADDPADETEAEADAAPAAP